MIFAAQSLWDQLQQQAPAGPVDPAKVALLLLIFGGLGLGSLACWMYALVTTFSTGEFPIPQRWEVDLQPQRNALALTLTVALTLLATGMIAVELFSGPDPPAAPEPIEGEQAVDPVAGADPPAAPKITVSALQGMALERTVIAGFLLLCLLLPGRHRPRDYGLAFRHWKQALLYGGMGFLLAWPVVYAIQLILAILGINTPDNQHLLIQEIRNNPQGDLIFWITVNAVIIAPLAEELMFRVLLQGGLQQRFPPVLSITVASALFAFVHGWPLMIPLFPLALMLGFLYYRQGLYLSVVVMHFLFNGFNILMLLLSLDMLPAA